MTLTAHVHSHRLALEECGQFKVAADCAALAEHPVFQESIGSTITSVNWLVRMVHRAMRRAGLPTPPVDAAVFQRLVSSQISDTERAALRSTAELARIMAGRRRSPAAVQLRALGEILAANPAIFIGFSGFDLETMRALIALASIELSLDPMVMVDQLDPETSFASSETNPARPASVLIVDDSDDEIMRTAIALIGWPNLTVRPHLVPRVSFGLTGETLERQIGTIAEAVMATESNIVLMDQGLGPINGSQVVTRLRQLTGPRPIIVANTGGDDSELRSVGALTNCDKGRSLAGLRSAVARLNRS